MRKHGTGAEILMSSRNVYQRTRETVKKALNPVIGFLDIETAIRVSTPAPVEEVEGPLREALAERGLHVLADVDVQAIHHQYNLEYPAFKILCVGDLGDIDRALAINPEFGVFAPLSVILYEIDGETRVSAVRPTTLLALFTDSELQHFIQETEMALWNALDEGIPDATMLSDQPPLPPGEGHTRATIKKRLNLVLTLVDAEYSIRVSSPLSPDQVEKALHEALDYRGQKVLGEVDVREDPVFRILLVGNPGQAHKALAIEPDVAVFVPLSVAIYEANGETRVSTVRPTTLLPFFADPDLRDIIQEMEMLLWNALTEGVPEATVLNRQPPLPPAGGQRPTAAGLPGGLGSARKAGKRR